MQLLLLRVKSKNKQFGENKLYDSVSGKFIINITFDSGIFIEHVPIWCLLFTSGSNDREVESYKRNKSRLSRQTVCFAFDERSFE